MNFDTYQGLAQRTANKSLSVKEKVLNGVMGMCGESGEAIDIVKKHAAQGHELDVGHLIEEAGDCLWYIAELCSALGVSMDDVANINIEKLKKRYPQGFDVEHSVHREE